MTLAQPLTGADVARLRRQAAAIGSGQPIAELTMFVVGARFENKRRKGKPTGNRQSEILMCEPGEPVLLEHEPTNPADKNAIAVYSSRGVQLGYISAERTSIIHRAHAEARGFTAIFQEATPHGAAIRVAFDGVIPTLPPRAVVPRRKQAGAACATVDDQADDWDCVDYIPLGD